MIMAAIGHVFTISRGAEMLGDDEGWLYELSIDMFPEDGSTCLYGVGDDGVTAFTDYGVESQMASASLRRRPQLSEERPVYVQGQRLCLASNGRKIGLRATPIWEMPA
jgi:hypothetical protein